MRKLSRLFLSILVLCIIVVFSGCPDGYQGIVAERFQNGSYGSKIPGVDIRFVKEDGSVTRRITSDSRGVYKITLSEGRYRVTATHPDYADYDSAPGFFVVSGSGYQTGNIFLQPLKADVLIISFSTLEKVSNFGEVLNQYIGCLRTRALLSALYLEPDSQWCLDNYGVRVTNRGDWHEIREVLRGIVGKAGANYIIIQGGPMVVPRPSQDVATDSGDVTVASDAWYVDFDDDKIVDDGLVISRLAAVGQGSANVVTALQTAIAVHESGGFSLEREVSFTMQAGDYNTPPYGVCGTCTRRAEFFELLSSSDYILFAGHGTPTSFSSNAGEPKFNIDYMDSVDLSTRHPIVLGYNCCNTGRLYDNNPTLATEFLKDGVSAFLARTTTQGVPTHVADNFKTQIEARNRIGDVLFRLMRETVLTYGNRFKASAGHLCIYGDPTLKVRRE